MDFGGVSRLEIRQQLGADLLTALRIEREVLPEHRQPGAAEHGDQQQQNQKRLAVHCAPACLSLRRLASASIRPSMVTSSGTTPMFTTFVQSSSRSVSTRRFLRSSLRSLRVSFDCLRNFSISACCSGVSTAALALDRKSVV